MNVSVRVNGLQSYHYSWLSAHPGRTESWLLGQLRDGFHIHHVDGDHSNDDPANLILIDGIDHLRLHGMSIEAGIKAWRARSRKVIYTSEEHLRIYEMKASFSGTWVEFAKEYHQGRKPSDVVWSDLGMRLSQKARKFAHVTGRAWPPSLVS